MITNEQVCVACAAYDGADVAHSQLAAMRKALEAYEASKWIKFDVDDSSTYPPLDQVVMCKPFNESALQLSLIHDSHA